MGHSKLEVRRSDKIIKAFEVECTCMNLAATSVALY